MITKILIPTDFSEVANNALQYAIQLAKEMNHPVEKVWIDGGNAKILAAEMGKSKTQSSLSIEATEGLVLRGVWAWLLQNL